MEEAERAAACCDTRKLYQKLKIIRDRPTEVGKVLLEQGGSIISDQARNICRWKEHFKRLISHVAPRNATFSSTGAPVAEQYQCEVVFALFG